MQLFPYQVEGAAFLAKTKRALLADEMGLGKSAQVIEATRLLCPDGQWLRVAIVCPASLVENWRRELQKFWRTDGGRAYVATVQSYDNLVRHGLAKNEKLVGRTAEIDVLILDEAHYLKSPKAKRTKAIFGEECDGVGGLVERAKHVFCLTGTPAPNNAAELWPMLRAVMPGAIEVPVKGKVSENEVSFTKRKPLSYWGFVNKYCVTQDTGFGIKIVRGKNLTDLKARMAPFVLRRKKDEVLKDLPPIRFDTLALEGADIRKFLDGAEYEAVLSAIEKDGVAGLKAIAPHVATLRKVTGVAKVPAAIEWIKEQLEGGLKKLVVFAHHREVLTALYNNFGSREYGGVMVTGSTESRERQEEVDSFQTDPKCKVFLGQIQAAGTGLTLTAANDVLFVESSWVPAENEQAAMRVHRIGQRNACLVRFAMLAGSIDEQIQKAVMRKTADIGRLFS